MTTTINPTVDTPVRRNATVTDRARMLADYIDAHPDLGEVCTLTISPYDKPDAGAQVQVTGARVAAALLAWFYRLDSASIDRSEYEGRTHVNVTGHLNGVSVVVYTGFYSSYAIAALKPEPTVHTLRALQVGGLR